MAADILLLARDLEQRDGVVAARLTAVVSLSESVVSFRNRVGELQRTLARLPAERVRVAESRVVAYDELERTSAALEVAEARVAELRGASRRRSGELERAIKEAATAADALTDARTRVDRAQGAAAALEAAEHDCRREETELAGRAAALSGEIGTVEQAVPGVTPPSGSALADLEGWATRSRAALCAARGVLEAERERIVVEANLLGASILDEELGASGVALVRRRLEAHLRS